MSRDREIVDCLMSKFYQTLAASGNAASVGPVGSYFLSYVSPGLPINENDFSFMQNSSTGVGSYAESTFSELVNAVPPVVGSWQFSGVQIWQTYANILNTASLPIVSLSKVEQDLLNKANALLWTKSFQLVDGVYRQLPTETDLYKRYRIYMNSYQMALSSFDAAMINAQTNGDKPETAAWWQANQPILQARVDAALGKWVAAGKNQVESAISAIDLLTGRDPFKAWAEMKSRFEQCKRLDTLGLEYYLTTSFSSIVVFSDEGWAKFSLSDSEIGQVDSTTAPLWGGVAPIDYKLWSIAPNETSTLDHLASDAKDFFLSFEFKRIPIRRPWLNESIFSNRAWKYAIAGEPLSDGAVPPKGALTNIPVELIVARNFRLSMNLGSVNEKSALGYFDKSNSLSWGPFRLRGETLNRVIRPKELPNIEIAIGNSWSNPINPDVFKAAGINNLLVKGSLFSHGSAVMPISDAPNLPPHVHLDDKWVIRPAESRLPHDLAISNSSVVSPGAQIIGFGCKLIPRCPDPDPNLTWP